MDNEINLTKRLIGKEDINFDFYGEGEVASYILPDGSEQTVRKINASHVPLKKETREKVHAENVDEALSSLSNLLNASPELNVLDKNTTVEFSTEDTVAVMQNKIDQQKKNLNGFTLTFKFPASQDQSFYSSLDWSNFFNGTLVVQTGNSGSKINIYDRQTGMDAIFRFIRCQCHIIVKDIHFVHVSNKAAIICNACLALTAENCVFEGKANSTDSVSIELKSGGIADLKQCELINDQNPFPQYFEDTKLNRAGGTMTGKILAPRDFINRSVNNDWLTICGGTSWEGSAGFKLYGGEHNDYPGYAIITAADGIQSKTLQLTPEGKLSLSGNYVVFSVNGKKADNSGEVTVTPADVGALPAAGGTMTGAIINTGNVALRRPDTSSYIMIMGGTNRENGASIAVYGEGAGASAGAVTFYAKTSAGNSKQFVLYPDGKCVWDNKNIVRNVNGNNADANGAVTITGLINKPVAITASSDLNDYATNGFYNCVSDSIAKTVANAPVTVAFALEVFGDTPTGATIKYQRVTDYLHYRTWVRVRYNGTWGAWKQLVNTQGINNAQTAVHGGADYDSGASLLLWGKDHNNGSDAPGMFKIRANNGTTASELIGTPAGGLSWNNKDITGGYPKYSAATQSYFAELSGGSYTASEDGFVTVVGTNTNAGTLKVSVNGTLIYHQQVNADNISCCPLIPVKAGDTVKAEVTEGANTTGYFNFFPNR
jgi:hypothetical protein